MYIWYCFLYGISYSLVVGFCGEDHFAEFADSAVAAVFGEVDNARDGFDYGYCTELLLQLLDRKEAFEADAFRAALAEVADNYERYSACGQRYYRDNLVKSRNYEKLSEIYDKVQHIR